MPDSLSAVARTAKEAMRSAIYHASLHDRLHPGVGGAPSVTICRHMTLLDWARGCTFDDFLLTPQLGVVPSRNPAAIDLSTRFSEHLTISRPIVSANMDTVTRAAM